MSEKTLTQMLDERGGRNLQPARGQIRLREMSESVKRVNEVLNAMTVEQLATFFLLLCQIWREARRSNEEGDKGREELRAIFGETFDVKKYGDGTLMYTLTTDGRQFRCWYGLPGSLRRHHVDSAGTGLLFEVCGAMDQVDKVARDFLGDMYDAGVKFPNGVTVYMSWSYR